MSEQTTNSIVEEQRKEVEEENIDISKEEKEALKNALNFDGNEEDFHPEEGDRLFVLNGAKKIIKGKKSQESNFKVKDQPKSNLSEVKEEEIPNGWTFDYKNKTGVFIVRDYPIIARIPTIGDKISIESRRSILSRGQYSTMAMTLLESQNYAVALINAISMIQVVCVLPEDFPHRDNLSEISDEKDERLLMEVYEGYLQWQLFFRKSLEAKINKNSK